MIKLMPLAWWFKQKNPTVDIFFCSAEQFGKLYNVSWQQYKSLKVKGLGINHIPV